MDAAVHIEHLSKRFTLGSSAAYGTLRDVLAKAFSRRTDPSREFWALDDLSFSISPGETVAVIGRNGAGKTTLLKILARILRPTSGRGEIRGRVAALLEIGTGFHGELSGRENVFMNGAILGMKAREIRARYASIVDFAELERFMETPVKHYSSGMQARLAFSIAAHLEADILLVDEVLAVGDAAFQKKCLGKMSETAGQGRTVLFVSHNMQAVIGLCRRGLLLDGGKLRADGPAADVVAAYHATLQEQPPETMWPADRAPGDDVVKLRTARVRRASGDVSLTHSIHDPVTLEVEFTTLVADARVVPRFYVSTSLGNLLFDSRPAAADQPEPGLYRAACVIPGDYLNSGHFKVGLTLYKGGHVAVMKMPDLLYFRVLDPDPASDASVVDASSGLRPRLPWSVDRVDGSR